MTKIYTPNIWTDEVLAGNERYTISDDPGTTVINDDVRIALKTAVTTAGTPVTADLMNNIENGLDELDTKVAGMEGDVLDIEVQVSAISAFDAAHNHGAGGGQPVSFSSLTGKPVAREVLTAARTYYVATTGLDSNTGLTVGAPFLTIQRAIDVCAAGLDLAGYTVTIQLADGTYAAGASVKNLVGMASPASLTIQGNATTPSNVYVNAGGGYGFYIDSSQALIRNLKVSGSVGIGATFSTLYLSNVEFGACSAYHMNILACKISFQGSAGYKISGNAALHMFITGNSFVLCEGIGPVSAVGTITFSSGFVLVDGGSVLRINGNTYPGTWIGTRYILASNGVIFTNGAAETYLPGSVLGVKSSGGQYV